MGSCALRTIAGILALILSSAIQAQDLVVTAQDRSIAVSALSPTVLRVRISNGEAPKADESWVVSAATRLARAKATIGPASLVTEKMRVTINPATLAIRIDDSAGNLIVADSASPLSREGSRFTLQKQLGVSERIFGMGDKTGALDRRGRSFVNWNTDFYAFKVSDDPTYKSIPFYISTGGAGGAYGLLLDNPFRSWFDFGQRRDDVIAFGAEDGAIDYYVIAGPNVADVVRRYADLTGKAPLPPRWVLGYQQSRWSYMTETEVRELAARLRLEKIPTDVIWLDIDFQDRNRPFTINREAFPRFRNMVEDLDAQGIKTVAITDLHIAAAPKQGYAPYDDGVAGDHFLKNPDGSTYVGAVWPGPSVFPDFTRKQTRIWWGNLFTGLLGDRIAGIWNDMNEPAIFETPTKTMPLTVEHRIEGDGFVTRTTSHREAHNVYGMENSRATYEGLRKLRPNERAFVMTRASFAGGQRYAATWTGDNSSTWDHLKLSVAQTLNLGLSGFSWAGADVGGFTGGPSPELLTRWFQYAAFAPIFRDHSQKDSPRAEPWVHGAEHLAIRRRYVEERYRLMPFIYALAEANSRTGDPIMRPILYDYPETLKVDCDTSMQFTLGGKLLVAGSAKPESPATYKACLPAGGWYDYWTGAAVSGQAAADRKMELLDLIPVPDVLPVFVRAGTVLPRQPLVQSLSQRPGGPLELHVYPGQGCDGEVYDDDGHSMGFTRGEFSRQKISCLGNANGLTALRIGKREGRFAPWWKEMQVVIHGKTRYGASLDGKSLHVDQSDGASRFVLPDVPHGLAIMLSSID
jgi:alpha-glucosidase